MCRAQKFGADRTCESREHSEQALQTLASDLLAAKADTVFSRTAHLAFSRYGQAMMWSIETANIRPGETVAQFTDRAQKALVLAKRLSEEICGSLSELNRWMAVASRTMTWMQAIYFSIEHMRLSQNGEATPESDGLLI